MLIDSGRTASRRSGSISTIRPGASQRADSTAVSARSRRRIRPMRRARTWRLAVEGLWRFRARCTDGRSRRSRVLWSGMSRAALVCRDGRGQFPRDEISPCPRCLCGFVR